MTATDDVWRALADPTRRRILDLLRERPRTTGELVEAFPDVTRFAVMKHLTSLEHADLLLVRREGRHRWNHINAVPLRRAYERFLRPHADAGAQTLLRLEEAVTRREPEMSTSTTTMSLTTMENEHEVTIPAARETVFAALTDGMGAWWPHRFREDATVRMEAVLGGRFTEEHPNGDGAIYATVTGLERPSRLELTGPMGMRGPVASVITFELSESGAGTVVALSHKAVGDISDDTKAGYAEGWVEVLAVLERHLAA